MMIWLTMKLRAWLGIDDDLSRTMLMMVRMDRRLSTRLDCMGLTAELIDPAIKVRLDDLAKRVTALEPKPVATEAAEEDSLAIAYEHYRRSHVQ
jgi:hypothetical protein